MTAGGAAAAAASVAGAVERVVFHRNGWGVVHVRADSGMSVVVAGSLPAVRPGERLSVQGVWESNAKYGKQLRASVAAIEPPVTSAGLVGCLATLVDGLGPGYAARLVEGLGGVAATTAWLDGADPTPGQRMTLPERLAGPLRTAWQGVRDERLATATLLGWGMTPGLAGRLALTYGDAPRAVAAIRARPYDLARDVDGIGFVRADAIALAAGVPRDSLERKTAALVHTLREDADSNGHTFAPQSVARHAVTTLCGVAVSDADYRTMVEALAERGLVEVSPLGSIGAAALLAAERRVAARVRAFLRLGTVPMTPDAAAAVEAAAAAAGVTLTEEQRAAVRVAHDRPFMILTGGAGVGKSTVTTALLQGAIAALRTPALAAPTGRAARRLLEVTGQDASTIHRLLVYNPTLRGFSYNADNPLDASWIVVDECSMIDIELFDALLEAIDPKRTRLVLVGDANQLPPVGAGAPFRDLVGMEGVPVVRLQEVHRQAAQSRIVAASRQILEGKMPAASPEGDRSDGALFLVEKEDSEELAPLIVDLVAEDLVAQFPDACKGPMDVQVIAPMRKGIVGVHNLNVVLRDRLNPQPENQTYTTKWGDTTKSYRLGDRVIQRKNDYERNVVNGEIGYVDEIHPKGDGEVARTGGGKGEATPVGKQNTLVLVVRFVDAKGEKRVAYERDHLKHLELAYCVTVHSMQGSQAPVALVVLHDSHAHMLDRSLLYTAVTRGQHLVVVAGTKKAVARAVRSVRTDRRRTTLPGLLDDLLAADIAPEPQPPEAPAPPDASDAADAS